MAGSCNALPTRKRNCRKALLGTVKTEDLGPRREKREQGCSRWVPSGSGQWGISPFNIISKGEERRCVSWPSPFNYSFLMGARPTAKEKLGGGLTKAPQALPKLPGTVGLARHLLAAPGSRGRNLQGRVRIRRRGHLFGES